MRLVRRPRPFDHPDWIFELKLDGFRALAHFENGAGELVSRNGNTLASFRGLAAEIAGNFKAPGRSQAPHITQYFPGIFLTLPRLCRNILCTSGTVCSI